MAKKRTEQIITPEWSHLVRVEDIEGKMEIFIEPDQKQKEALARRLGLLALSSLTANLVVERENVTVNVAGSFKAKVTQECVVTMEPVDEKVEDSLEAWFADPEQAVSLTKARHEKLYGKSGAEIPILDEKDDPEPIIDGNIDLGELVTQYLSLAINPYPHAEGVEYEIGDDSPEAQGAEIRKNPFAALKEWKEKQEK